MSNQQSGLNQSIQTILNIRYLYILMLLTVAGWSIFGYLTMHQQIEKQSVYAELINLAGKQRMLSQKTALMTVRIEREGDATWVTRRKNLLIEMRNDHQYIVSNLTSDHFRQIYFHSPYAIDDKVKAYLARFNHISQSDDVTAILDMAHQLLPVLNFAVSEFEKEATHSSQALHDRETYILIGTLLTLLLEALLIVLPSFRRMQKKEQAFEEIFDVAPIPIVMVDLNGQTKQKNSAFIRFCRGDQAALNQFTCRLDAVYGLNSDPEQAQRRWSQQVKAAQQDQGVLMPELYKMVFEEGTEAIVEISGQVTENEIVVTLMDVTEKEFAKQQNQITTELLNQSQHIAKLGSWSLNLQTQQLIWSEEIYELFELDPAQFTPSYENFLNAIHPEDVEKVNAAFQKSMQEKIPYQVEHRLLMTDGRVKYVREQGHTEYDEDDNGLISTGTVQDITEQKAMQDALDKERQKYKNIMSLSSDGLFIMRIDNGELIEYSQRVCQLLRYSDEEMSGLTVFDWDKGFESLENYRQLISQVGYEPITFDRTHTRKDGTTYCASITAVRIDIDGEVFLSASVRDVTEHYKLLDQIKEQSITDELTQLKNRRAFYDQITHSIGQYKRHGIVFSVLLLDIDHFKSVNDTYGHQVGDDVLIALSQEMVSKVRETDAVYRFGGEEFVILLTGTGLDAAVHVAEQLRVSVQQNVHVHQVQEVTISIGVAEFGETDSYDTLIKRADDNLYRAKESGRNRVVANQ